jgi:1-phosphatidylinositol-4-phosphate 5-kinase
MTINEDVSTTEYAPAIFSAIRDMDNVTDAQIQNSLNTELNRTQVFKAKESAGKSGSFFFFSYDKKFLIKTMNNKELKVFLNALSSYIFHL